MKKRCFWVPEGNTLYEQYHDTEWGVPVHDDAKHFEFLVLESAQAGLSWETILKRREGYRRAFAGFDVSRVARFTPNDVERLLADAGIIRNRQKVTAAIKNATAFMAIQKEWGSFDAYIWSFVGNTPLVHAYKTEADYVPFTQEAVNLSKDLKKRGFQFVGPTIIYAHMQACGLVNDHIVSCFRYHEVS